MSTGGAMLFFLGLGFLCKRSLYSSGTKSNPLGTSSKNFLRVVTVSNHVLKVSDFSATSVSIEPIGESCSHNPGSVTITAVSA